jgi:hypothetical protein
MEAPERLGLDAMLYLLEPTFDPTQQTFAQTVDPQKKKVTVRLISPDGIERWHDFDTCLQEGIVPPSEFLADAPSSVKVEPMEDGTLGDYLFGTAKPYPIVSSRFMRIAEQLEKNDTTSEKSPPQSRKPKKKRLTTMQWVSQVFRRALLQVNPT